MESTQQQVIYEDAVATLVFDAEVPCTIMTWHGFASSQDFREACMRALEIIREKRLQKGLSDARRLRIISLADQQWFMDEYIPLALELGLGATYSAVVVPEDFFGRQSLDRIREQVDSMMKYNQELCVTTRYFETVEEARSWLLTMQTLPSVSTASTQAEAEQA